MPTVSIKLRPHLKEYYCNLVNTGGSAYDLVCSFIRPFLAYTPKDYIPVMDASEYFEFELPAFEEINVRNNTVYIPEGNIIPLKRIMKKHFNNIFFTYMDDKIRYIEKITDQRGRKAKIKNTILQFTLDFNLSYNSDLYDLLKKAYYREKIEREKLKEISGTNNHKMSLYCPSTSNLTFL